MELYYWLAAKYWQGMGLKTLQQVLSQTKNISALFTCTSNELLELGLSETMAKARAEINWAAIENELKWGKEAHNHIVAYTDEIYPSQLRNISSPPLILYLRGNTELLAKPNLAIVGSRKPTAVGKETAFAFAEGCASLGLCVCSGLAYGIDAAAHRGALAVKGATIAVLGSGLNQIYPKTHLSLSSAIFEENGLLISESAPNMPPNAHNFPKRNRIISGLSMGVLIVEAAAHSGSLITARLALEQGREVFAVPGSIYNHLTRGTHLLIREGAKLVESIQDILEELPLPVDFFNNTRQDVVLLGDSTHKTALLTQEQQQIWQMLDDAPSTLDQLLLRSKMTLVQLRRSLVHLELQGYARIVPGGYQRSWPIS